MVVKGQEILKYLQNLRDSDKPAAGVELDAFDVQGVNEFETSAEYQAETDRYAKFQISNACNQC